VTPEDYNEQLIWTSSDEEVLTVDKGRITALKPGKSTITLKGKEALATMEISVVEGNISHLGELVEEVETLLGDPEAIKDIHEFLIGQLEAKLEDAQYILENESEQNDESIKKAYDELLKALKDLDQTVQFSILDDYMNLDLSIYDRDTTDEFKEVLEDAKELVDNIDSIESVIKINERFKQAVKKLEKLDFKQLQSAIAIAEDVDMTKLTDPSRQSLKEALNNANATLESATTNKEIQEAVEKLEKALENIKHLATNEQKETIKSYVDFLEDLDLDNYAEEDQEEISSWIAKLKKHLDNKDLDKGTAKKSIKDIMKFIEGLRTYIEKPFEGQPDEI